MLSVDLFQTLRGVYAGPLVPRAHAGSLVLLG